MCHIFSRFCFLIHDIPIEYRHRMILTDQLRLSPQFSFFPQIKPCVIGRHRSECVLDRRSSQIGGHLRKVTVKRKSGMILFCFMHQMLRFIKAFLWIPDFRKFFPGLCIHRNQIGNCFPENIQCRTERYILFINFYSIAGYNLHKVSYFLFSFSFCPSMYAIT